MRRSRRRVAFAAILVAIVTVGAAGCAPSGESGSRHTLYNSLDSLARDSSAIVVGSVTDQRQESSADFTTAISTVEVTNNPSNPQLGTNLDAEPTPVAVGDVIQVRQDLQEPSVLEPGQEYLLYLTPSMLPGNEASDFFITGAVAGAYLRDGDKFTRVVTDGDDDLPDTIDIAGTER